MKQDAPVTGEVRRRSRPARGVVAIIASSGGIPALIALLRAVAHPFPLPILIVQHLARGDSRLDAILTWHSRQTVDWAAQGQQPQPDRIYLTPPGMRLAVTAAGFELSPLAPRSSSWLGCGDHLIESLVALYGAHTIGIVLSGALPAAVNGLRAIKARGGFTMAQDRGSSGCFDMPAAAIDFAKAELVMPPDRIARVLDIIVELWRSDLAT
jgi:two-component system chemotaxis response regulator CheB